MLTTKLHAFREYRVTLLDPLQFQLSSPMRCAEAEIMDADQKTLPACIQRSFILCPDALAAYAGSVWNRLLAKRGTDRGLILSSKGLSKAL